MPLEAGRLRDTKLRDTKHRRRRGRGCELAPIVSNAAYACWSWRGAVEKTWLSTGCGGSTGGGGLGGLVAGRRGRGGSTWVL